MEPDLSAARSPRTRPRLTRGRDKVIAGVADGIGTHLGVDPVIVRIAFVVLTVAGGIGVPAYIVAWIAMPDPDDAESAGRPLFTGRTVQQTVAVGMIMLGGLLVLRNLGFLFSDALVWPITLAGVGAAVLWTRTGEEDRVRLSRLAARLPANSLQALAAGPASLMRAVVGGLLVVASVTVFLAVNEPGDATQQVVLAMFVAAAGLGLLLGPWVWRLVTELSTERRERIRSEERADMAAHLHDSVLQTLALIQRKADQPRELVALARRQERELRAWLYGDPSRRQHGSTVAAEIQAMAEQVEDLHGVEVDVVSVGDQPLDERTSPLVNAIREAVVNAARHSQAEAVSVFVEIEPTRATAFVRDRGQGFDPAAVPADRRGIADSIVGRLTRRGGTAVVTSAPGEGTEVQLEIPLDSAP